MPILAKRINLTERAMVRFWAKVEPDPFGGCWLWTGALSGSGNAYGVFSLRDDAGDPTNHYAHRIAYTALIGEVPPHLQMDHLCRVRCCVNPAHLEPVTPMENNHRSPLLTKTACKNGHPFNDVNSHFDKHGWRRCRVCDLDRHNARYAKHGMAGRRK